MHAHHYYRFAASLLTVLLAACGGGGGPGAAEDKPVVVPSQPSTPIDKTLLTGTLKLANTADARVFWDRNDNWEIDADEVPVQVDPTGSYLIAAKPTEAARLRVHVAGGRMVEEGISHTGIRAEQSAWRDLGSLAVDDVASPLRP